MARGPDFLLKGIKFKIKSNLLDLAHNNAPKKIVVSIHAKIWLYENSTVRSRNSIDVLLSFANGPKAFTGGKMGKKLYVGNLSYSMDDQSLASLFSAHGTVESARVVMDRDSGRSKGFAFVEMSSDSEAQSAIEKLNGTEQSGRAINVSEAKPMAPRDNSRGGGGGRSFGNKRY